MKPPNELFVILPAPFDHPREWIREPLLELTMRLEDMWHEEVHEGPKLHEVVLKRGTCQ